MRLARPHPYLAIALVCAAVVLLTLVLAATARGQAWSTTPVGPRATPTPAPTPSAQPTCLPFVEALVSWELTNAVLGRLGRADLWDGPYVSSVVARVGTAIGGWSE